MTTPRIPRIPYPAVAALLLAASPLSADTIILNNGTTYEGRVLKDEGDSYLLEIQVTRSIRDERRVLKTDIKKIQRVDPSEAAFETLSKAVDTPDLLPASGYELRISKLQEFLKEYPESPHKKTVQGYIDTLQKESEAIAAGSIKLDGQLINPEDRKANALAIDARIQFHQMRRAAESGRMLEALRDFDVLENEFPGTAAHRAAVAVVDEVLAAYRKRILSSLATLEKRIKDREIGLQRMPAADRNRAKAIFDEQQRRYEAAQVTERAAGIKWFSVNYHDRRSLEDAERRIETESRRIERFDDSRLESIDEIYSKAWKDLEGADEEATKKILNDLSRDKVPEKYMELLNQRAADVGTPPAEEE